MNVYCLYFPNGKRYVGVESTTGQRIYAHGRSEHWSIKKPQTVTKAIAKFGWKNIKWRYLACWCSKKDAGSLERFFIRIFNLQDPKWGYNIAAGGRSPHNEARLHFNVDDRLISQIKKCSGLSGGAEIARNGIELLAWATQQIEAGREIQAFDPSGNRVYVPSFPVLDQTRW